MVSPRPIPRIVLDTNVLVSGLLTPAGPSARLLALVQRGEIRWLYDERLFQEYAEVLKRARFGFTHSAIEILLEFLKAEGEHVVARPLPPIGVDPSDQPFFEVAVSGKAELLITGNQKHFPKHGPEGLHIVAPSQALRILL